MFLLWPFWPSCLFRILASCSADFTLSSMRSFLTAGSVAMSAAPHVADGDDHYMIYLWDIITPYIKCIIYHFVYYILYYLYIPHTFRYYIIYYLMYTFIPYIDKILTHISWPIDNSKPHTSGHLILKHI